MNLVILRADSMNSFNTEIGILNWYATKSKSPEFVPDREKWVTSKPLLEAKKVILNKCHTLDETLEEEIQCYNLDVRSHV